MKSMTESMNAQTNAAKLDWILYTGLGIATAAVTLIAFV